MTVGLRLFVSSAVFAIAIATAYWLVSRELIGTVLLGIMAFALLVVAGYMTFAERGANVWGDRANAQMSEAEGERVGRYTTHTMVPLWTAVSLAAIGLGLVISPTLAAFGVVTALVAGAAFIVRSR